MYDDNNNNNNSVIGSSENQVGVYSGVKSDSTQVEMDGNSRESSDRPISENVNSNENPNSNENVNSNESLNSNENLNNNESLNVDVNESGNVTRYGYYGSFAEETLKKQNGNDTSSNYASTKESSSNYINNTDNLEGTKGFTMEPLRKKETPPKRKRPRYLKKLLVSMSLGLSFGLFGGIGFFAVQQTLGLRSAKEEVVINQNVDTTGKEATPTKEESQSGIKLTDTSNIRVISSDVSEVVDQVMPAMVSILNSYTDSGRNYFGQQYSEERVASGSGIIIAESETELLIATNYHVISDANSIEVVFIDESTAIAQLKGKDVEMDLAVVSIPLGSLSEETKNAIAIATMGDSESLNLGEPVIAIGNALGYGQSVTNGIVSALNREIELEDSTTGTFIQTNAAINPGNSGGALLNMNGEVIGINSNKIGGEVIEGMGYAIPISAAKPIITELMMKETRMKVEEGQSGYMGISLQPISAEMSATYKIPQGVYVISVEESSPAEKAGILSGDIIVKFGDEKITSYEDLQDVLQYYAAGDTTKIMVKRPQNGEYQDVELEITLTTKPTP
ncbi:trypsin-like peptidase domain-containing protein [Lachnospiraceae bacterium OttesenSCG-928-D06]|nr:trypsin-like peptidase domain-containing protein [Lachnospiraceae bacterium OttesenSCG-928-D06]